MPIVIRVAGVQVPRAAVADLALDLREKGARSLADTIAAALDRGNDEITLNPHERGDLLDQLDDPPLALAALRAALVQQHAH